MYYNFWWRLLYYTSVLARAMHGWYATIFQSLIFFILIWFIKENHSSHFFKNLFVFSYVAMTNLCPIFFMFIKDQYFHYFLYLSKKKYLPFLYVSITNMCSLYVCFFLSRFTDDKYYSHIFLCIHKWYFHSVFFYQWQIFDPNLLCNNDRYFSYFFIFIMTIICYLFIIDKYLSYFYM